MGWLITKTVYILFKQFLFNHIKSVMAYWFSDIYRCFSDFNLPQNLPYRI